MPMILVKKNPRGKVIRELSSEEETAVKTVCGLKKPATMALHNLANDILREMREYDAWLQCDCIPGDSPAMNFAALKNNTGTLYLSSFNHEHAPECPMYRQLSGNEEETSSGASRHPVSTRINYRNFYHLMTVILLSNCRPALLTIMVRAPPFARNVRALPVYSCRLLTMLG